MSGTQASQWEGHLAAIMWRSEVKSKKYESFFDLLRSIYTLDDPPQYHYSTPLFDSWPDASNYGSSIEEDVLFVDPQPSEE